MMEHILLATGDLDNFLTEVGPEAGVSASGGTPNQTLTEIIGAVISAALGALGIIFLILMVYAGFLWATSQGAEDKIKKAKGILSNSVIGLVITLAAYAIATFVVGEATTATGL